jgi:nucleoside-diphosphate kinase
MEENRIRVGKTLLMIKPDAVERNLIGEILKRTEAAGFKITNLKMAKLSLSDAKRFYQVHEGKPFFQKLVEYMSSGKVVAVQLKRANAVKKLRELVGATDPKDAKKGTIRHDLALDGRRNAVHASDSARNVKFESKFFF